jgi:uncharacterized protein YggE
MRKGPVVFLPLLVCSAAFGQLDSNSITVGASNNSTLQPDQAVFAVGVQSPTTTGLDDVITALQGSGITAANFASVSTAQQNLGGARNPLTLLWTFSLSVPLANTKTTVASLTTLQQNIANLNNGLTLSFSIAGTQVSQQLAQSQTCSLSGLIASATTEAQSLAAAGGVTLGPIIAMSGSTSNVLSSPPIVYAGPGFISTSGGTLISPPCAVTVKFSIGRH